MSQASELVAFCTARLHERESIAVNADRRRWRVGTPGGDLSTVTVEPGIVTGPPWRSDYADIGRFTGARGPANAMHAAANDPSCVLDDIEAKWRVLARHRPRGLNDRSCLGCGFNNQEEPMVEDIDDCPELRDLGVAFRGHPDYKSKWDPA